MASLHLRTGHIGKIRGAAKGVLVVPRRLKSRNPECDPPEDVKCKTTKNTCPVRGMVDPFTFPEIPPKFRSMWWNPFCDETKGPCPVNPRFDDLYYVESDKAERRYWQTWVSCPKVQMKLKKVCDFKNIKAPPVCRRPPPKVKSSKPCPPSEGCMTVARECSRKPHCPSKCVHVTDPSDCKKPMAPYPAFSECLRLRPGELPLSECLCWTKPLMCEIWMEYRKRYKKKKSSSS